MYSLPSSSLGSEVHYRILMALGGACQVEGVLGIKGRVEDKRSSNTKQQFFPVLKGPLFGPKAPMRTYRAREIHRNASPFKHFITAC